MTDLRTELEGIIPNWILPKDEIITAILKLIEERLEKAFSDVENEEPICVCVGVNLPVILEEGDSGSQECRLPISYLWDKLRTAFKIPEGKE